MKEYKALNEAPQPRTAIFAEAFQNPREQGGHLTSISEANAGVR